MPAGETSFLLVAKVQLVDLLRLQVKVGPAVQ